MARMRMFASRTIILSSRDLVFAARRFELSYNFFFVHIREGGCKTGGSRLEFRKLSRLPVFAPSGNVDAQSLAAPSDGNGRVRFKKRGDALAKFTDADFDGSHRKHLEFSVHLCVHSYNLALQAFEFSCGSVPTEPFAA